MILKIMLLSAGLKKVVHDRWIDRRDLIVGIACTSGLCINRVELIFLDKFVI